MKQKPIKMTIDHMDMTHKYCSLIDHVTLNGERNEGDAWVEVNIKEGWGMKIGKAEPGMLDYPKIKVEGVFEIFILPGALLPEDKGLIT